MRITFPPIPKPLRPVTLKNGEKLRKNLAKGEPENPTGSTYYEQVYEPSDKPLSPIG